MTDQSIEQEIQARGLTAPRVTPERIEEVISGEAYFTAAQGLAGDQAEETFRPDSPFRLLTFCVLVLKNGFTVTGESACASPENFNAELGRKIARQKAVDKIWPLEGYLLASRLSATEQIARVAHEVNRAYCQALGDDSQPTWEDAPGWQRSSAINGVKFHLHNPDAGPDHSHNAWLAEKEAAGWKWGTVKDPERKEHPCFVPYEQLPVEQKAKDFLFRAVVHALR